MEVQILDDKILKKIADINKELEQRGKPANQGVQIRLTDPENKQLFFGEIHPNMQYEFEATDAGEYTLCVMVTEMAFETKRSKVKTSVKFSAEFHRSKQTREKLVEENGGLANSS